MNPLSPAVPDPRSLFERTSCACSSCTAACEHMPGGLIPGDVERIARLLAVEDLEAWALEHLEASQGASVPHDGKIVPLPTIVPRVGPAGGCVFLLEGRCSVHAVSPFGCAYLDMHMSRTEAERRSAGALLAVANDWATKGPYSRLWGRLYAAGNVATALERRQTDLHQALAALEQTQGSLR